MFEQNPVIMHNNLSPAVARAVSNIGFDKLNPMQSEMIRVCRKPGQVLLFSPTGSGKTAAFLLPVIERANPASKKVCALIIVPSRELALQTEQVFKSMATGLKVTTCYGGHPVKTERNNLVEPPFLVVGTPGRILYHLEKGTIDTKEISTLILDEYDKIFEFGFEREISSIFKLLPTPDNLVMTSATKSAEIPGFINISHPVTMDYIKEERPAGLEIKIARSEENDKLSLLVKLLSCPIDGATLVFCNHRDAVERISNLLKEKGIWHDTYHGGHDQPRRERALIKFRNGSTPILVTTDLASRGLDITGVKNIVHYQPAGDETIFTHRNGRTARMDKEGTVWILLSSGASVPDYVPADATEADPEENPIPLKMPYYSTLYFGAGKKDKISKADIVGLLIQKGGLKKEEIGMIHVLDYESFAAVPEEKIRPLVKTIRNERLKNKKVRIEISD